MSETATPWWRPDRYADRRPLLLTRNLIKTAIRDWFLAQGFVEVEPGALVVSPGNETHLQAFQTELVSPDRQSGATRYLHTSPEFACKKLLAAGETMLFTFAASYRNCESGPLHAPEFTMLEWYRAGDAANDQFATVQDDCDAILQIAARTAKRELWQWRQETCRSTQPSARVELANAAAQLLGIDIAATIGPDGRGNRAALASQLQHIGWTVRDDETWGDLLSKVLVEIEQCCSRIDGIITDDGVQRPFILTGYPACMSPLARTASDPAWAQRFELFACGVELANGFGEENDPEKVRNGLGREMDEKERLYAQRYPIDEDFIEALALMPTGTAGCALGFDRLVMLATGAAHIDQILWTPPAL